MITPGDISETYVPLRQLDPAVVYGEEIGHGTGSMREQPNGSVNTEVKPEILDFWFRSNREILLILLHMWKQGSIDHLQSGLD
jgi:hypothetical protein